MSEPVHGEASGVVGNRQSIELGLLVRGAGSPVEQAQVAEHLGFDFLAAGEHVSFRQPVPNALLCLAAAAAATERIGLMTAITLAPVYPPPLLAKMTSYLDVVAGGRLQLGLGIGGEHPQELLACGIEPRERGARTSELIEVMRDLWSADGPASFVGEYTSYDGLNVAPPPVKGDIPIWISGRSDAAIRRAIAYECGWFPYMYSPKKLATSLRRFAELGDHRPPAGVLIWVAVHEDPAVARSMALRSLKRNFGQDFDDILDAVCIAGTPERAVERIQEYADAGAERILLTPCVESDAELDAMRDLIAQSVLPALRS